MYNIHIVKRFRAHCGFYAIENKLLLLIIIIINYYYYINSTYQTLCRHRPPFDQNSDPVIIMQLELIIGLITMCNTLFFRL